MCYVTPKGEVDGLLLLEELVCYDVVA
jgi:hypothetical protein